MTVEDLALLQRQQEGVVSRRQAIEAGLTDSDIERKLRRHEWARVHTGVFVDHTGPLTWEQRCWAAVLYFAPAALGDRSALRAYGLRGHDRGTTSVHLVVDRSRTIRPIAGVVVRHLSGFEDKVLRHLSPPRERLEHAVLGEASRQGRDDSAIAVVADAVQQGRTTVGRLVDALADRPRLPRRAFLLEVLEDVRSGAYSVLEHRYLTRVERPHGLPVASRQRRVRQGRTPAYRDVDYLALATAVELDGRVGHDDVADGWADLDRDVASLVAGDVTLRVRWKQVLDPCRLAGAVASVLAQRGWDGTPHACGPDCAAFPAPGAGKVAQTEEEGAA